jgi:hypothetical protein
MEIAFSLLTLCDCRQLPFYLVGWVLPVLAMIPYVVIHSMHPHNSKCWTTSMGSLEWVHYPVPLLCLAVSRTCF